MNARALALVCLAAGLAAPAQAAAPEQPAGPVAEETPARPDFGGETPSDDVRTVADWALGSGDSQGLPVVIIDKRNAVVYVLDRRGKLIGSAPALLGLGTGDTSVPGIGERRLATISPNERTTPAGRYQAALGHDFVQDILWIDYDSALSLHRVITGNAKDRRRERLASPSPLDNRISYGCVNVPPDFYNNAIVTAFKGSTGIVYILPETTDLADIFPLKQNIAKAKGSENMNIQSR